jgi:PleD family two-component response regulator
VPSDITASIGGMTTSRAAGSLVNYLATAGRALYQAKTLDRNRVCLISDDTPPASSPPLTGQP